jgi:cyclophilin family peptidyl-prolyl cis-trans isomerase
MPPRLVAPFRAKNRRFVFALLFLLFLASHAPAADTQYVRFNTIFGSMDVQLLSDEAPNTVTNFLDYATAKDYNNTIIHRSLSVSQNGLGVIQGGGYDANTSFSAVPSLGAINNEFNVSNTAGTLAMALTGSDINSATNEWFFNTVDNSAALDPQSFTVFGTISPSDTSSLAVMNALASVPVYDGSSINGAFGNLPLTNYVAGTTLHLANFVIVSSIVAESLPTTATVTLPGLPETFVYTGKAHAATATTNPAKLKTIISYNNGTFSTVDAPTAVGTYTVLADLTSPGYSGSATGTITITAIDPTIVTGAATSISATGANLNVTVNPKTDDTSVYVEYGLSSTAYTGTTTTADAGSGAANISGYLSTTGTLTPGTLYHYRAVATSSAGTVSGADKTFTTLVEPVFAGTAATTPILSAAGAVVSLAVNPHGVATTAYFEYSTDPTFTTGVFTTVPQSIGKGTSPVTVTGLLSDLDPDTLYYYELVTVSAAGTFSSTSGSMVTSLAGFSTSVVAATTGTATGTGGGKYNVLGAAGINDTDGVAFYSTLTTSKSNPVITAANDAGIWANEGTDTLTLIAQTGTPAVPGLAGAEFSALSSPVYNQTNGVAFEGTLKAGLGGVTAKNELSVWSTSTGTLQLVAREGDPAPGGTTFSTFTALGLLDGNTNEDVIVIGTMAAGTGVTASSNTGIWEGTLENNLALKLRTGDMVGGETISTLTLDSTQPLVQGQTRNFASNTGDLALLATFTNKTTGIVTSFSGVPALAYKVGSTAPISTGTATFAKFDSPIINNSDHLAFEATVANGGVTAATSAGIWSTDTGTLQLVAQTGSSAPDASGNPSGAVFATLNDPLDNNYDVLAFSGTYKLSGKVLTGLFYTPGGTLTRVVQTGDPAPGCATGVNFGTFKALALPDAGGTDGNGGPVFGATLTGIGVTAANNTGIWAMDDTGTLQLIVRTGDSININPTGTASFKTISSLTFLPYTALLDGQTRSMTTDGDLTYTATFTDKTTAVFSVAFP